jgi:hypothetical protein
VRKNTTIAIAAGFVGGLVAGAVLWGGQIQRSRRELFSRSPWRRLAALGYLAGRPGLDTVRLLTDYVRWERHTLLRKRGELLLERAQHHLD